TLAATPAATGDFNQDGRVDLVVVEGLTRVLLLENTTPDTGHWVGLDLVGSPPNTDAIGAVVEVRAGGLVQRRVVRADSAGGHGTRFVHVGVRDAETAEVQITWPDGTVDAPRAVPVNERTTIHQGSSPGD